MNFLKNRKIGVTISYLYFVLNTVLGTFVSGFVVQTVGKTNYGVYQTMAAFAAYLILLEFGTGTIMARNISLCKKNGTDNKELKSNLSTIWSLSLFLSALIAVFSVVFYLLIDQIYSEALTVKQIEFGKKIFICVSINLIATFLTQTLNGVILGHEYYAFEKSLSCIRLVFRTVLVVILLTVSPNVMFVVLVDLFISLAVFLMTLFFYIFEIHLIPQVRYFSRSIFKSIFPLCLTMLMQTIATTLNGNVDKFLIGIMLTPEHVTVYSISMTLFSIFSSVATIPVSMYMPKIAASMRDGISRKDLTESLIAPCRLNMIITGALTFGIVSVGQQFIQIVYGIQYKESWLYAILVIVPMFIAMSNAILVNVLDVLRKRHYKTFVTMFSVTINLVLTIFGIKYIGLAGAAAATGISTLIEFIVMNVIYAKKIEINVGRFFAKSAKGILLPLLIALIISFPVRYVFKRIYIQFLIGGVLFCAVFAFLFLAFGTNEFEKDKIKSIKLKIKNKKAT